MATVVLDKRAGRQGSAAAERGGEPVPVVKEGELYVARAELVLARPDRRRLAAADLEPDPLEVMAAACAHVNREHGEQAELIVDLVPVPTRAVERWRRKLMRSAGRRGPTAYGEQVGGAGGNRGGGMLAAIVEGLNGGSSVGSRPARRLPRQSDLADGVGKFLPAADTKVFAVQVLVRVSARHPAQAQARLHQVMAVLDAWRGENWWRPVGPRRTGWRPYSNVWWRRRSFDRRYLSGEFAPVRRQWVTAKEVAALLKPPSVQCSAANVMRTGGVVPPAPPKLPEWTGQAGLVPLGRVTGADGRTRLAGVPQKDVLFGASLGKAGYGKSELALLQAIAMAYGGFGAWFADPHGAAVKRALPYLTHPAVAERVWLIDLSAKVHDARVAAWNPLDMEGRTASDIQDVVGAVVGGLTLAQGWGSGAYRARAILSQAVLVLTHLALRMCERGRPDLQPTLFTIHRLLTDEEWRQTVLAQLPRRISKFWMTTFPDYEKGAVPVITQTLQLLETSDSLRAFLGQPRSTYRVRQAMDEKKIVLIRCSGSGAGETVITALMIFDLFLAGLSREGIDQSELATMWGFVDEMRAVDGAASGTLAAIFEQLRKYEVRLMAMTQMLMRLNEDTRMALMQNQSLLTATGADHDEAGFITKRLDDITPKTIQKQPKYSYVASATINGKRTAPFRVLGVPLEEVYADYRHPERVPLLLKTVDRTMRRRTVGEILLDLDGDEEGRRPGLDDRILRHLTDPGPPPQRRMRTVLSSTDSHSEVR
ncbi:hypothetical protein RCO28_34330 [Streptomyces sp. LHD-70]|uniref:hypothetical protein n=1 Tax=Streptomyces sp. LHD-70 TaxID=3072140 RepID=UPI00280C4F4F|nr:hypothetical protein [Streptomyces sp. LHD-70]MDQ8707510.1 hypothetical protein [Streptomyces sp. LHD-70]